MAEPYTDAEIEAPVAVQDNLLNRRRRKDLARMVGPRTLDGENVCTRCGVPDVHCQCHDALVDDLTSRGEVVAEPGVVATYAVFVMLADEQTARDVQRLFDGVLALNYGGGVHTGFLVFEGNDRGEIDPTDDRGEQGSETVQDRRRSDQEERDG